MKIIKTVQATKNRTTAESGSINTPILNQVSPVGNQANEDSNGCSPRRSTPSARTKPIMLPIHESNAAPTATLWLSILFLFVNNTIEKNASTGGSGISQINVSVVIYYSYHFIKSSSSAITVFRRRYTEMTRASPTDTSAAATANTIMAKTCPAMEAKSP